MPIIGIMEDHFGWSAEGVRLGSTQPDQLEVFPNHKLPKRMRYKSDREIYAPAKLFRSKKSTSLLGLVPANIYHPFSQPHEMYDEKTRILT